MVNFNLNDILIEENTYIIKHKVFSILKSAFNEETVKLAELLMDEMEFRNIDLNILDKEGRNALYIAVCNGRNPKLVEAFINRKLQYKGILPETHKDSAGLTMLHAAISRGKFYTF